MPTQEVIMKRLSWPRIIRMFTSAFQSHSPLCDECKDSNSYLSWLLGPDETSSIMWSRELKDIQSNLDCTMCNFVMQILPSDIPSYVSLSIQPMDHNNPKKPKEKFRILSITARKPGIVQSVGQIAIERRHIGPCAKNNDLDNEMNLDVIRDWLMQCKNHYHPPLGADRYRSTIDVTLIDVYGYHLVETTSDQRYVALSYIWGGKVDFTTTSQNRTSLKIPGSLSTKVQPLPVTIRDAIELVRKLGMRYLWVDALCID